MSEGNGKTIIAIVLVVAIIGAFYLWYTGGSLGSLGGGGASYQSASGIAPMGGGGGGGKKGTDWGAALLPLGLGGLGLTYVGTRWKTKLTLTPQTGSVKPVQGNITQENRIELTASLKFGWDSPYKREIKFKLEPADPNVPQVHATINPAKKRTDTGGKSKATLTAGGQEEDVVVKATYEGIITRKAEATSTIKISRTGGQPPTPIPQPDLTQAKEHIKEKIARKAQARFNLQVPQNRWDQFKNCVITKLNTGRARDMIEDALGAIKAQTNPPRTDQEILNLFANTAQFDSALDQAFATINLDAELTAKEQEIRACAAQGPPNPIPVPMRFPAPFKDPDLYNKYLRFAGTLRTALENMSREKEFLMWKLFVLTEYNRHAEYTTINYADLLVKHPLAGLPAVQQAILDAGINPQSGDEKELWSQLAARAIVYYYTNVGGTKQKKSIGVRGIGKVEIGPGNRSINVLGKMKLGDSFLKYITPQRSPAIKNLTKNGFGKEWDTYKQFFIDYEGIIQEGYLVNKMDFPPTARPARLADKGIATFKERAYITYYLLREYFNDKSKINQLRHAMISKEYVERELNKLNLLIGQNYNEIIQAEIEATNDQKEKDMIHKKTSVYKELCGRRASQGLQNLWKLLRANAAEFSALTNFPPKKTEFDSIPVDSLKRYGATDEDIEKARAAAHMIANAVYAVSIRSLTAVKLYAYILARFADSIRTPKVKDGEELVRRLK